MDYNEGNNIQFLDFAKIIIFLSLSSFCVVIIL